MSFRVELAVLSEQKQFCRFGLTLHNLTDQSLDNWQLQFIIDRFILPDSFTHGEIKQVGSFCTVKPDVEILEANQHYYCEFSINTAPFRFYTDGLKDAVIIANGGQEKHQVVLTPIALASPYRERAELPSVDTPEIALIPKPNKVERFDGKFQLTRSSQITLQANLAEKAATWLQLELERLFDFKAQTIGHSEIVYRNNPTLDEGEYQLTVSGAGVRLEAGSRSGFVHASATLLQLIEQDDDHNLSLPCIKVVDAPRFKYRGMMLDCARHFHSVEMVKRLINQLAHYKFNTFHWHLTDDEGWRLEIKALPELTKTGGYRGVGTALEPQYSHLADIYGGYYSQEEVKEVIAYADERGINVIPEIDIPGHCRAAIKSLPELLQDPNDRSQYRSIQHYNDNVLSPALAGTYEFLDKVLQEVAELFPSPWVHIGADEVPDGVWLESPACQKLMQEKGYQSAKELQGHLLGYAEKKLRSLGKRMVGWEEAQHGNKVSKDTVIYSWLSEEAALNCAKQGFDVILQPGQSTYLDMTQDYSPEEPGVDWAAVIPLENAYRYEPLAQVPDNDPIRKRILGIQCALWSEIVTQQNRMDYMVFPRLTAMAEACWTEKSERDWEDYLARLKGHLPLLDRQDINYRQPWK
ncbi:family 20 glycosylhydrolase [Vibrio tubiashii]|uniref:beta-N-acetylhexosaminidase n=1 Tax=Vibrio tubiashii TaxID=29498 RepID=UPI001EFE47A4|nr:family 20 glycosylhydrolase [Vibrio tubiashii]MCG9583867.1 family 20 glycosylhydrolase [Vibrio tubiashii]MCG9617462.1 family 20 glycosylhydrolase [Vibrio tubiashii]MCG9685648.1 family 20 glycosylhydrolase [Vibrio tubiashii]